MTTTQSLDGDDWEVREALGETWRWYVAPRASSDANSVTAAALHAVRSAWLPARVPGAVVDDLVAAGEVPEPRRARDSRFAEWAAERSWVYRRTVDLPELPPGQRVVLELDGADPGAIVHWDGRLVGTLHGLYHRARVEIGVAGQRATAPGPHVLALVVPPAPESEPQVGRTERVDRHTPRLGYGWDFSPRLRHQGIWRSVRLRTGTAFLADVAVRTREGAGRGTVHVDVQVDAVDGRERAVRVEVLRNGAVVAEVARRVTAGRTAIALDVDRPDRWWPATLGEPALYDVRVALDDGDEVVRRVGFRTVRLVPNPGAPAGALGYRGEVNGRELDLVGWNWVPVDAQFGSIDAAAVRHLVDLAARSGARLLRVWGGGLVETEEFYDACDETGLLVWQEFSQSSSGMQSGPSAAPRFVAHLVAEAEAVVPRLAGHASLAIWCGGNELEDEHGPLDEERSPALAALRDAVARLDPDRAWLPTSPSGPVFHNRLDRIVAAPESQHDVHGPWEHQGLEQHYALYNAGTSLAHTEFGVEGMTNRRALEAIVPAEVRWPADRRNPVYRHLGEWWNNAELVQSSFGGRLADVESMLRASQFLQATGLQYAVEADRRRAPRCGMVLPWQLGESFPNAWCTSAVDHFGEPKPAFFAVSRAFRRERVTIRVERAVWGGHDALAADAWAWSEPGRPAGSTVTLRLLDADGYVLDERTRGLDAVRDPVPALALEVAVGGRGTPRVVLWEAEWRDADGALVDREVSVATTGADFAPLLDLAPATVDTALAMDGDHWELRLRHLAGPVAIAPAVHDARPIAAAGRPIADVDPRPLLPGESRRVPIRWRDDDPDERRLVVDAWNMRPVQFAPAVRYDRGALR